MIDVNAPITTTPEAIHVALAQSVDGWVDTQPLWTHLSIDERAMLASDLTTHLYGNVVMTLRFATTYTSDTGCDDCKYQRGIHPGCFPA